MTLTEKIQTLEQALEIETDVNARSRMQAAVCALEHAQALWNQPGTQRMAQEMENHAIELLRNLLDPLE